MTATTATRSRPGMRRVHDAVDLVVGIRVLLHEARRRARLEREGVRPA